MASRASRTATAPPGAAALAVDLLSTVLGLTPAHLRAAFAVEATGLGTADRLHVAVALDAGCDVIVTTDRDFDDVAGLRRVDPSDADAMRALIDPAR